MVKQNGHLGMMDDVWKWGFDNMRKCIVCGKNFEHWGADVCSTECSNELEAWNLLSIIENPFKKNLKIKYNVEAKNDSLYGIGWIESWELARGISILGIMHCWLHWLLHYKLYNHFWYLVFT